MKKLVYRLKKLNDINGLAEIREKEAQAALNKKQNLEVRLDNEVMILTPAQLEQAKADRIWMPGEYVPSGVGYWLWRCKWQPIDDEI